jgi:hypothetical protein
MIRELRRSGIIIELCLLDYEPRRGVIKQQNMSSLRDFDDGNVMAGILPSLRD